jgi:hypothetical protein
MKNTLYLEYKEDLKQFAIDMKKAYPDDKPLVRMALNDRLDSIIKDLPFNRISEKRKELYINWLSSYVCELHPK